MHAAFLLLPDEDQIPVGVPIGAVDALVGLRFTVGVDGRAGDCAVEESGGDPRLDTAACALVIRHAVTQPAVRDGHLVPALVRVAVRWSRGDRDGVVCTRSGGAVRVAGAADIASRAFADLRLRDRTGLELRKPLSATGTIEGCSIMWTTAAPDVADRACETARRTLHYLPAIDASGAFRPTVATLVVRFNQ